MVNLKNKESQLNNRRKVRLGEVIEKVIDNRGKTPPLSKSGYPMVEVFQLSRDRKYPDISDSKKQKFVSKDVYNTWFRSGHPNEGDILVSTVGTIAQWGLMPQNRKYCIAQNVVALRPDLSKTTSEFLLFYLNQRKFVSQVEGIAIGAAQPSVRLPHFLNLEIEIPSLNDQKRIAEILSVFDEKIENNSRIIKTLEEMAQAIFKEWFVKFRFPGHQKVGFVDSELGRIPKEWEVKKFSDIAHLNRGVSYSSKDISVKSGGLPMINLANFFRGGGFNTDGVKHYTGEYKDSHLVKPGQIVIAMTDLTSNREVIGHPARVPEDFETALISLDVCSINTEDTYVEFLYSLMLRRNFSKLMAGFASGTNVSHLSKTNIEEYLLILPNKNLLSKFNELIRPIFTLQINLEAENRKLAAMRDLLLPKLMKGEIKV